MAERERPIQDFLATGCQWSTAATAGHGDRAVEWRTGDPTACHALAVALPDGAHELSRLDLRVTSDERDVEPGSKRLSPTAHEALREAERTSGFVVSVVTLIDLWYVSQTTGRVSEEDLRRLTDHLTSSDAVILEPVKAISCPGRTLGKRP